MGISKEVDKMIDIVVCDVVDDAVQNISTQICGVIDATIDKVNDEMIQSIRNELIKIKDPKGTHKKTELLLYAYPKLKNAIQERMEQISEIENYGVRKKSGSITTMGNGSFDDRSEMEKAEDQIDKIQKTIKETLFWIDKVETALDKIRNDKYYYIIEDHYFRNRTYDEIAKEHYCSPVSLRSQKNRLIRTAETKIFLSDYVDNVMIQIGLLGYEKDVLK